jgi:hypothetical protein
MRRDRREVPASVVIDSTATTDRIVRRERDEPTSVANSFEQQIGLGLDRRRRRVVSATAADRGRLLAEERMQIVGLALVVLAAAGVVAWRAVSLYRYTFHKDQL